MKSMIKNTLILTAITLVSGLLLGLVYEVTKEPIANAQELAKKETEKGKICLLSPAAASYNVYKNFEVRGDHFKSLVSNSKN